VIARITTQHDPEHLPGCERYVFLATLNHGHRSRAQEPSEAGKPDEALVGAAVFVIEHGLPAVFDPEVGKPIGAMSDRRNHEILDLETVDFEPLVFANEGA
jgi:hypothetical protein